MDEREVPTPGPDAQPPPDGEALMPRQDFSLTEFDPAVLEQELDLGPLRVERKPAIDPWAHRRGEPRVFAFLWTVYVLLSVAGSLLWLARSTVVTASTYGPAARVMLVVVSAGAVVLWPMVRLSQTSPRRGVIRPVLADLVVILFPLQMVVWPLIMLAQWPLDIVAALSALTTAWVFLIGGVIATAFAIERWRGVPGGGWSRAIWMLLCLVFAGGAPLVMLARRAVLGPLAAEPVWADILSPFTAIGALTGHGFSGPQAPVSAAQWWAIAVVLAPAAVCWLVAAAWPRPNPAALAGSDDPEVGVAQGEDRA